MNPRLAYYYNREGLMIHVDLDIPFWSRFNCNIRAIREYIKYYILMMMLDISCNIMTAMCHESWSMEGSMYKRQIPINSFEQYAHWLAIQNDLEHKFGKGPRIIAFASVDTHLFSMLESLLFPQGRCENYHYIYSIITNPGHEEIFCGIAESNRTIFIGHTTDIIRTLRSYQCVDHWPATFHDYAGSQSGNVLTFRALFICILLDVASNDTDAEETRQYFANKFEVE